MRIYPPSALEMSNATTRISETRGRRIADGVSSLVDTLITPDRDEKGGIDKEKAARWKKLVKRILER